MRRTLRSGIRGFTLIEMLASMAILLIISLFVARLFNDGTRVWKLGNRRVEQTADGRAVIEFMVRELSAAIADDRLVFAHRMDADSNILGMDADRIYFVTTDQIAEYSNNKTYRQIKMASYHIAPMRDINAKDITNRWRIVRSGVEDAKSSFFDAYINKDWWTKSEWNNLSFASTLAENVRTLEFWLYDTDGKFIASSDGAYVGKTYRSDNGARPLGFIEIYIEMLGEQDAVKAAMLMDADKKQEAIDFADRASRRYVGRVYMNQGRGYAPGT